MTARRSGVATGEEEEVELGGEIERTRRVFRNVLKHND